MINPVAVFDIETEGWDRFFCGAVFDGQRMRTYPHDQERAMVEDILSIGAGDVLAHNGGRFDFLWFLDALFRHRMYPEGAKLQAVESGASVITLHITGAGLNLKLRDSWRMFPVSLRTIGGKDEVGVTCTQRNEDCREAARLQAANGDPVVGCGGYCAIRVGMPRAAARRVLDYCAQDCRALWDGTARLIAFADSLDLALAGTTGATAWKTARAWGLIEPTPLTHREWHWIRDAYFGGRVGLFQSRAGRGWHYDITSSYPHQMSQPLPEGKPRLLAAPSEARRAYRAQKPGIYQAEIVVPSFMHIPPLPWRAMIDGERRNAYPIGRFAGAWALPEIEYAESIGCQVDPLSAMVFPSERDCFRPLEQFLIAERLKHGKKSAEGQIIKLWANAGYGKLAQEPRTHRLVFARSSFEAGEGAVPINRAQTAFLVPYNRTPPLPESSHAEKAAYITARGRIQLHRMLTARGGHDAIYCDTDSCFATQARGKKDGVRDGLGGWADEGEFRSFRAMAPKLYAYEQREGVSWRPVMRAKGIALPKHLDDLAAARAWDAIETGAEMHNRQGVLSLRTAMRKGGALFKRKDIKRSTSGVVSFGDRLPTKGGGSRPPKASELTPFVRPFEWK